MPPVDFDSLPALSRAMVRELAALGVDLPMRADGVPAIRAVPREWWDTNDLQVKEVDTIFFQNTRTAHARKLGGTNLENAGVLSLVSDVLVTGVGVDIVLAKDQVDAGIDDVMAVRNYGLLREIRVKSRPVFEAAFFTALPMNRGFTVHGTGYDGAAPNFDQAANGAPGQHPNGVSLMAAARFYVAAGERVEAPVVLYTAADLAAVVTVRVHLLGIELGTKGMTPNNA